MLSSSLWLRLAGYLTMATCGAAWAQRTRGTILTAPASALNASASVWGHVVTALAAWLLAWGTVALTRYLVLHNGWAQRLHRTLRGQLLGSSSAVLLLLAVLGAASEELLFRAALGPTLGTLPACALFGMVHLPGRDNGLPRAAWAFGMGLCLSGLYLASGTLLVPILAHAVINYENMQYICNYDPTPLDIDRFAVQRGYESDR